MSRESFCDFLDQSIYGKPKVSLVTFIKAVAELGVHSANLLVRVGHKNLGARRNRVVKYCSCVLQF